MKKILLITSIFVSMILIGKDLNAQQITCSKQPQVPTAGQQQMTINYDALYKGTKVWTQGDYARNIILTDINGTVQNMYSYLTAGKPVIFEDFAVW